MTSAHTKKKERTRSSESSGSQSGTHFKTSLKCSPQTAAGVTDGERPIFIAYNSIGGRYRWVCAYKHLPKEEDLSESSGIATPVRSACAAILVGLWRA